MLRHWAQSLRHSARRRLRTQWEPAGWYPRGDPAAVSYRPERLIGPRKHAHLPLARALKRGDWHCSPVQAAIAEVMTRPCTQAGTCYPFEAAPGASVSPGRFVQIAVGSSSGHAALGYMCFLQMRNGEKLAS